MLKMVSGILWMLVDWIGIALERLRLHRPAMLVFRRAVAADPDDHFARWHLAWTLLEQGGMEEASQHFRELLARWREEPDLYAGLGSALQGLGRHWEAIEAFLKLLALRPRDVDARYNLATSYAAVSEYEKAIAEYQAIMAMEPADASVLCNIGVTFGRLGHWEESEGSCRRAVELEPSSLHLYNLGIALAEIGRLDEAEQVLRRALDLKSEDRSVRVRLAMVLSQRGRLAEAVAVFTQSGMSHAENVEGLANLVSFILETGHLADGLRTAETAVARYPDFAWAHTALGWALLQNDRFTDALASFERALALDVQNADAWAGRAATHSLLHEHARALEDFSRLSPAADL